MKLVFMKFNLFLMFLIQSYKGLCFELLQAIQIGHVEVLLLEIVAYR